MTKLTHPTQNQLNWLSCQPSPLSIARIQKVDPSTAISVLLERNFSGMEGGMKKSMISQSCMKFIVACKQNPFDFRNISKYLAWSKNWTRWIGPSAPAGKESWNASFWNFIFLPHPFYQSKRDVGQVHLYKAIYPASQNAHNWSVHGIIKSNVRIDPC